MVDAELEVGLGQLRRRGRDAARRGDCRVVRSHLPRALDGELLRLSERERRRRGHGRAHQRGRGARRERLHERATDGTASTAQCRSVDLRTRTTRR